MLALGIVMVIFRQQIYNFTGQIDFIESWFPGGTHSAEMVFGLALCLLGILFITGVGSWLTGPITDQLRGVTGGLK